MHMVVTEADPDGIFTARMMRVCREVTRGELAKSIKGSELAKCTLTEDPSATYTEVVYQDMGVSLYAVVTSLLSGKAGGKGASVAARLTPGSLLPALESLLFGLAKMAMSGIVHMDLSCNNVLMTADRVTIVDFGLSQRLDTVYAAASRSGDMTHFRHTNEFYAPEFRLAYMLHRSGRKTAWKDVADRILVRNIQPMYFEVEPYVVKRWMAQARAFHAQVIGEGGKAPYRLLQRYEVEIDTFAAGVNILYLLNALLLAGRVNGNTEVEGIYALTLEMMNFNPARRIHPLAAYLRLCAIMRRQGKEPKYLDTFLEHARATGVQFSPDQLLLHDVQVLASGLQITRTSSTRKRDLLERINMSLRTPRP